MAHIHLEAYAIVPKALFLCAGTHDIDDANFQLVARPIVISLGRGLRPRHCRSWVIGRRTFGNRCSSGTVQNTTPSGVYVGNPAKFVAIANKDLRSEYAQGAEWISTNVKLFLGIGRSAHI